MRRYVVIGSRGKVKINPREAMGREADIRGMVQFHASAADLAGIHAALFAGLESAALCPVLVEEFR